MIDYEAIPDAIEKFPGVEHRIEHWLWDGVKFIGSIQRNQCRGVDNRTQSAQGNIILIAGVDGKAQGFELSENLA